MKGEATGGLEKTCAIQMVVKRKGLEERQNGSLSKQRVDWVGITGKSEVEQFRMELDYTRPCSAAYFEKSTVTL